MTTQRRQFTLRSLFLLTLAVAVAVGLLRIVEPEWLTAMMVLSPITAVCMAISCLGAGRVPPPGWQILSAICIPSLWLLWLALHPSFYYMVGLLLIILLWLGVGTAYVIYVCGLTVNARVPPRRTPWLRSHLGVLFPLTITLLVACRIPLHIGFLTARPGLTALVENRAQSERSLALDQRCGLYTISATHRRKCHVPERIIFILADDAESGFIYSPNGIEDLCYNSGNKGHLFGNWYWMKED